MMLIDEATIEYGSKILLVRLRLIGDVVFTTPLIRALRRAYPDARIAYLVERTRRRWSRINPHLDEVIVAPRTRGLAADRGRSGAGAPAAARAVRSRARSPRRPAQRVADLGERRAQRDRLRHPGPALDVHAGGPRRASCGPGTRWPTSGICSRRFRGGQAAAGPGKDPSKWRWTRPPTSGSGPAARAGVGGRRRAGRAPRERGQPVPAMARSDFAETAAALAAGPRRRMVFSSGPSDREAASRIAATRAAGSGRRRTDRRAGRVRSAGAQSADRPEPAVRRRRHRAAAHRGDHGHAGRGHLRADAGGALGAMAAGVHPTLSIETPVEDLPCRPCDQRVCAPGRFPVSDSIDAGSGDRGGGQALRRASGPGPPEADSRHGGPLKAAEVKES